MQLFIIFSFHFFRVIILVPHVDTIRIANETFTHYTRTIWTW